ncbi:MAG TPA: DUF6468 domain-containing protein [Rhizomicrobium sp.]|jgi:hypothetical protein|nr:DUF6468 domain-containing protein [Rhizomicrobium sp.]
MTFAMIVELSMSGLLAATLIYCAVLERRLAALRNGQDGLKETIGELNSAIVTAGASMRMLKSAAADAGELLDERLGRARALSDELSVVVASGERIADRIVSGTSIAQPRKPAKPNAQSSGAQQTMPANLSNRLDALRNVR